jgi:ATP-dependent Clp protease adapter protein ClpS
MTIEKKQRNDGSHGDDLMSDVQADAGLLRIVFRNDNETPAEFVVDILHSVFKKSAAETARLLEKIDKYDLAVCGIYSRERANKLLAAARRRIRAAGHPLLITSEAVAEEADTPDDHCKLCGTLFDEDRHETEGAAALICDDCPYEISRTLPEMAGTRQFESAGDAIAWHFAGISHDQMVATSRQFPRPHARGRSGSGRQAVLHVAGPVFWHP